MGSHSTAEEMAFRVPITNWGEPTLFDISHYRSRMARYLLEDREENQVFFDALEFAHSLHAGQRRKSGAPFISHPCAVAEILARELEFKDPFLLSAAILHDVVEDIPSVHVEDIADRFGLIVAELVDGCTKLTRQHLDRATLKDLTHSKIFLSASRRLGVLIIKLADRLHNLRTLHYLPHSKRQRIAQETVEVYAPIAARFNIYPLKRELYHLALSFLYPRKSKKILQHIRTFRNSPEVADIEHAIERIIEDSRFKAVVRTRAKGLGSYYSHLKKTVELSNAENHVDFAIVMETENIIDCYTVLGLISTNFSPVPRSLRDFIANAKNNGYQSLHVRILVGTQNYLIKIRTPEMDRWATYGIVSEWDAQKPLSDEHWQEISELLKSIGEYGGAATQRKALIRLSESEEIFTYSPRGDIYFLPKGSIVLDFAYKIHSELGEYCEGALVNNEWSFPTRQLQDGDIVEILTSHEPLDVEPDLEELCKTPKARTAINKQLQQKRIHYAQEVGKQILLQEIRRHHLSESVLHGEHIDLILEFLNLKDFSELFTRLGQDLISPKLLLYYLASKQDDSDKLASQDSANSIPYEQNSLLVEELDKAIHKFARCCKPYPGQENVVATLSERGITFHHKDCQDITVRHDLHPQQLLRVIWNDKVPWRHPLTFHISIVGEKVADLLSRLASIPAGISIRKLESRRDRHQLPIVQLSTDLKGYGDARSLFSLLPKDRFCVEAYGREEISRRASRSINLNW